MAGMKLWSSKKEEEVYDNLAGVGAIEEVPMNRHNTVVARTTLLPDCAL